MARTPHEKFYPKRAQIGPGLQPVDAEFHDVLVIPPLRKDGSRVIEREEFYRFPVVKVDQAGRDAPQAAGEPPADRRTGTYSDLPEVWSHNDIGQRKVFAIAHPDVMDNEGRAHGSRGPAFAIMPVKPEPGSSSCAFCYLINAQQVLSPNAWTAEEWNAPGGPDFEAEANANKTEAEVLLALPRGIVLRLRATNLDNLDAFPSPTKIATVTEHGVTYEIEPIALNNEAEIWSELRNGCIAGRVFHRGRARVIPLLNVTSLMSRPAVAGVNQ